MNNVTIKISDEDIETLEKIFENEPSFNPMTKEDRLIVEIMRQVLNNPKIVIEEE